MNRREVLKLGVSVVVAGLFAKSLEAKDFRKEKPAAWKDKTIKKAIKDLFGTDVMSKTGVEIKAPEIAENGAVVPVTIKSAPADTKVLAVLQDADPESLAAVITVHPRSIPEDISLRLKLKKSGKVVVVAQTADGKLHYDEKKVKVTMGGCGG